MSFRNLVTANIPKVDLQSYILLTAGNYKSGKTRWWKEIIEYFFPNEPEAGLLVAWEPGYKTWKLKSKIDLVEYKKEEEKIKNGKVKIKTDIEMDSDRWIYFKQEIVTGLVQESKVSRISKVVGFDTVDRMIDCASAYIIVNANNKYPGNNFTSIQELSESKIYKDNVWNNLYDELKRPIDTLRAAGYGLIFLAWTKEKTTELVNGVKYNSIELMMNATCRKVFQSQADLICCLHNEVTALDKEGNELNKNLENKNGKEIATKFHESQTYMYFRESSYIGIAGGRFKVLPDKELYGIDTYVRVFKEAIEGQLDEGDSFEDIRKKEIEVLEEKAKRFSEDMIDGLKDEDEKTAEDYHNELKNVLKDITNEVKSDIVAPKMKELLGVVNFLKSDDTEKLKEALDFVNALNQ
ncbi:AAA family ATPase [Paenibacillus chitinolyticus]|uniref:AAA family ATPase n=1 Tax=Paenibacillus chitinolyticus TaxID=79263 RepID=UPI0036727AE2